MRTCRARSVHLLGGSRLPSLSSTRRDQYILPWLFSIQCLGPASNREPVFPSYRGTATDSQGRLAPAITPCGRLLHGHESAKEWAPFEAPTIRRSKLCRQFRSGYREAHAMGARARQRVEENFSLDAEAAGIAGVYRGLI